MIEGSWGGRCLHYKSSRALFMARLKTLRETRLAETVDASARASAEASCSDESKSLQSAQALACASFAEICGISPASGQAIAKSGSSQTSARASAGESQSVVLQTHCVWSECTKNPWAKPGGVHGCGRCSALSSTPPQLAQCGAVRRRSSATSNTRDRCNFSDQNT
jgi:hypothetical protein